tara:strand:+ start:410 stop:1330 length:921 start_codon:yes stop_codon:yes gene_type:complete
MNKVYLLELLLKLIRIKKQLENPLSTTLCCKSYIFDEQFNTTEVKKQIDKLDESIFKREELTNYDPTITEEILSWFQTDKCKTPTDKLIIENFQSIKSKYEWLKMINENRFIQTLLHYSNIIVNPLFTTSFICVIMGIFIYYVFMKKYNIRFPLNSFVNILKNSILIRNNFPKMILTRINQSKYILCTGTFLIFLNLVIHIYNVNLLLNETEVLYNKIKLFKRQIQKMKNISDRLCKMQNETADYFMNILTDDFYERSINKIFLLTNRGRIISDYFKIANKKNKLGKLFQLNGMCCYMKILRNTGI